MYRLVLMVIAVAIFFRFVGLAERPVSLNIDEAANSYDAWSIARTGRDMYGSFFPVTFRSLNDYKPPLYIYLSSLVTAICGPSPISIRLVGAISGVVIVLMIMKLVHMWAGARMAISAGLVAAVTPWFVFISRVSSEANLGFALLMIGIVLSIEAIKNQRSLYFVFFWFSLSMYAYHLEKFLGPASLILLLLIFRNKLGYSGANLTKGLLVAAIVALPLLSTLNATDQSRSRDKSIFNDPTISSRVGFEKYRYLTMQSIERYLQVLDIKAWIVDGLDLTFSTEVDQGWLGPGLGILALIGVMTLVRKHNSFDVDISRVLVGLSILIPLPSLLLMDDYHRYRLLPFGLMLVIIAAVGICTLWRSLFLGKLTVVSLIILNSLFFLDMLWIHNPYEKSHFDFYPWSSVMKEVHEQKKLYNKIIVDPRFGMDGPSITALPILYYLLSNKVDPKEYQSRKTEKGFDNIEVAPIDLANKDLQKCEKCLMVGSVWSLPNDDIRVGKIVRQFTHFDGSVAIMMIEINDPKLVE